MNLVDDTYLNKAMFLAAISPEVDWLQPPSNDEEGDYVYKRRLKSWRVGALRLVVNDETYQPNVSVVKPMEDFYSVLTLGERASGLDSSKINILARRDNPFMFDNPRRAAETIRLTELALVQDRKMQALARVKLAAENLGNDFRALSLGSDIDNGFDGVAVVEEIVTGLQDSGLAERYRATAVSLSQYGVDRIEGPGNMPGWSDTLHPDHVISCIDASIGYFAA